MPSTLTYEQKRKLALLYGVSPAMAEALLAQPSPFLATPRGPDGMPLQPPMVEPQLPPSMPPNGPENPTPEDIASMNARGNPLMDRAYEQMTRGQVGANPIPPRPAPVAPSPGSPFGPTGMPMGTPFGGGAAPPPSTGTVPPYETMDRPVGQPQRDNDMARAQGRPVQQFSDDQRQTLNAYDVLSNKIREQNQQAQRESEERARRRAEAHAANMAGQPLRNAQMQYDTTKKDVARNMAGVSRAGVTGQGMAMGQVFGGGTAPTNTPQAAANLAAGQEALKRQTAITSPDDLGRRMAGRKATPRPEAPPVDFDTKYRRAFARNQKMRDRYDPNSIDYWKNTEGGQDAHMKLIRDAGEEYRRKEKEFADAHGGSTQGFARSWAAAGNLMPGNMLGRNYVSTPESKQARKDEIAYNQKKNASIALMKGRLSPQAEKELTRLGLLGGPNPKPQYPAQPAPKGIPEGLKKANVAEYRGGPLSKKWYSWATGDAYGPNGPDAPSGPSAYNAPPSDFFGSLGRSVGNFFTTGMMGDPANTAAKVKSREREAKRKLREDRERI